MADLLTDLYKIVDERRQVREQGSYTVYLFDAGIDKILKKLGEETTETIIAAKNLSAACEEPGALAAKEMKEELVGEIGDLLYHLTVMCCEMGVAPEDVEELLRGRMQKKGNLKESRRTDRNT